MNTKVLPQNSGKMGLPLTELRKMEERAGFMGTSEGPLWTLSFRCLSKCRHQKRSRVCEVTPRRDARLEV